jgi:predicted enzyme related to lactoylglutathione lyase
MPDHLAAAVIYVKDMNKTRRFYEAIAGLALTEAEAGHVVLETGVFQLILVAMPAHLAAGIEIADPPTRRQGTPVKLVFFVTNMAVAREQVATLGGQLNSVDREWIFQGFCVCDGHDPEGNVFQLREKAR